MKEFLEKLQNVVNGKICFHAGLLAEKNHDLETAKSKYQEALTILPNLEKCWTRLNILEIKNQKYQEVLLGGYKGIFDKRSKNKLRDEKQYPYEDFYQKNKAKL